MITLMAMNPLIVADDLFLNTAEERVYQCLRSNSVLPTLMSEVSGSVSKSCESIYGPGIREYIFEVSYYRGGIGGTFLKDGI